jgi:predicted ATP-grasp superfamily ATP-dependent carboligase
MSRPSVVVIGLDCPTGLQTARVFAARGIDVIGIAADLRHPCALTRSCRRVIQANPDSESIVDALRILGGQLETRAVLVPCTDLAVLGVARHREELSKHFLTSVPAHSVIEQLMDKAQFAEFAVRQGLPVPTTHVLRSRTDAETTARKMRFPCVLKPSVKSVTWDVNAGAKALIANSPAALLDLYDRHAPWAETFVVQEWIPGDDADHYTCDSYVSSKGEPLATFSSRKLRQWPPVVGQGCLSVEHRNDAVRDEAMRTLSAAGHHGQGYVELKWDARSSRHLILEANVGRPTGRSSAAEKAGVELLMTMYCDLVGDPLPAERTQHYRGSKWIHIRRDLQASIHAVFTGRSSLAGILRSWRGSFAFALFSLRDPVPFFADLLGAVTRAVRLGATLLGAPPARRRKTIEDTRRRPAHPISLLATTFAKGGGLVRPIALRGRRSVKSPLIPPRVT